MSPLSHRSLPRAARILPALGALLVAAAPLRAGAPSPDHLPVTAALSDLAVDPAGGSHALSLPGIGDDFQFVAGGQLYDSADGTARLVGVVARESDPAQCFALDLRLGGKTVPGDLRYPPRQSPLKSLMPSAYSENGGTADSSTWVFYTSIQGTLTGLDDLAGAVLTLHRTGPAFQRGPGANNRNLSEGLGGIARAQALSQPLAGPALPAAVNGVELCLSFGDRLRYAPQDAVADEEWTRATGRQAFGFRRLGKFVVADGIKLVEHDDGTARLTGVLARTGDPAKKFALDVTMQGRINPDESEHPPAMAPKKHLKPGAYVENGFVIDTDTWHYYAELEGTLTGLGQLAGYDLVMRNRGAVQVGLGASGFNLDYGMAGWLELARATDEQDQQGLPLGDGDMTLTLRGERPGCVDRADAQEGIGSNGGHVLYLPGIGTDFVFAAGGELIELPGGTARLIGLVRRTSASDEAFEVDVVFGGRLDPTDDAYPPPMSPKKELATSAYAPVGPVDPSNWHYYETMDGTLTGVDAFLGAELQVTRRGPAFQVGLGANGKNTNHGGSGWLDALVLQQPNQGTLGGSSFIGDFNVDLDDGCPQCPDTAEGDPKLGVSATGDTAFWLPGIGTDFAFEAGAEFVERADGTATLTGIIARGSNANQRFEVRLDLSNRVNPDGFGFVPTGSPKKELPSTVYVENGGIVDTDTWHYYLTFDGTLTGLDDWAGALLSMTRRGPALQVGLGANGRNLNTGASGWLDVRTLLQPTQGPSLPLGTDGDLNVDLDRECP